jgi:hypothetical protein
VIIWAVAVRESEANTYFFLPSQGYPTYPPKRKNYMC